MKLSIGIRSGNLLGSIFTVLLCLPLLSASGASGNADVIVDKLTVEYMPDPVGIDATAPLLGWQLSSDVRGAEQTAYHILVASNPAQLRSDRADMWDSGIVESPESQNVGYSGVKLAPATKYYWKVQIWDANGKTSKWSDVASWQMGMCKPENWQGEWISSRFCDVSTIRAVKGEWGNDDFVSADSAAVYMRKEFSAKKKIKQATAFICGLGYYELYLNGIKVGNRIMDPLFTDYQKRSVYATYDVTSMIEKGENCIGVILGNGFYSLPTRDLFQMEKAHWKTAPKLIANILIEYASGEKQVVMTDNTWKWGCGELVFNSIRAGETIDHTKTQKDWNMVTFEDQSWSNAVVVPANLGKLSSSTMPPMRVNEEIAAVKITEPKEGVYVVDFGENMTGWIEARIKGDRGDVIDCYYNELLNSDGTLNVGASSGHTSGRFQQEKFIVAGGETEIFEPRFTYHGFRYVEIHGLKYKPSLEDFMAKSVHTAMQTTGEFECSDPMFNRLNDAIRRTLKNSVHSMPGEEATREKMGWTLDAGVTMESYLYNFDAFNTYKKSLQDFMDAQADNGHIPSIVPTNGWGFLNEDGSIPYFDDPWWGGAIFIIVDRLWDFTGDRSVIEHSFDALKRYVDYIETTANNDLVSWSLGDWLDMTHNSSGPGLTPVVNTSTAGYYWMNERLSYFAKLLGKDDVAEQYAKNAVRINTNFNRAFLDKKTGSYAENSQTAQALPLFLGMVPTSMKESVEQCLLENIAKNNYHISSGFIGASPVMEYLALSGNIDTAFRMIDQRESSGWMYMVADGNSTMGENLNGKGYGSQHHPYGTHIGFWLYKYLGGIRPDKQMPGFKSFIIEPYFVEGMDRIHTSTHSLYGKIVSSWKRDDHGVQLSIVIPGNTDAKLLLPKDIELTDVSADSENDSAKSNTCQLETLSEYPLNKLLRLKAGSYEFVVKSKTEK